MATSLPEKLRTAEISRFALRAAQLEKFKPIISYWCNYWIVQQVLSQSLHTQDNDCLVYTTDLMDRLEQVKAENTTNDAIQDDVAAQAYVEQFALETFNRADATVRADKASAQTADTFKAAATFLDLLQIFGQLDPEFASKSKYAKYHALRIAKAIKAGEDPNLSNPKAPPAPTVEDAMDVDGNDPDVQAINGDAHDTQPILSPAHAPALHAPEAVPSPAVSPVVAPVASGSATISPYPGQISPGAPPEKDRSNSVGGGYFPAAPPTFTSDHPQPDVPIAPEIPSAPDIDPSSYYQSAPAPAPAPLLPPPVPPEPPHPIIAAPIQPAPSAPSLQSPPPPIGYAPPPQAPPSSGGYRMDEESIADSQKHARWAISALNFEDIDTAVKELRIALRSLGAT